MLRNSLLLLLLLLAGCDEQEEETKAVIRPKLTGDHYKVSPRPKPKPKTETVKEEPLTDYLFPDDDEDIKATLRAHNRLGEIRYRLHQTKLNEMNAPKEEVKKKDVYILIESLYCCNFVKR